MVMGLDKKMTKSNLTVTHVIHSGGFYGAERMLVDLCLATQHYVENTVVLISAPQELLARFEKYGIYCVPCNSIQDLVNLTKKQSTIINAHNFKAQIYAWLSARRNKLPLIFTQHGFTPRSIKQHIYMWTSIFLCKSSTVQNVVCVANSIAVLHQKFHIPKSKIEIIYNGLPKAAPIKLKNTQPTLGFIGRLSFEKGPDLFLDTVIPLLKENKNIQALILGDGPEYQQIENKIKQHGLTQRIKLLGYQENISDWLVQLSILVISSRTEGTPMVLLEAMQAGVPVVAFAVGGIPDVIAHNQQGLLAEALNTDELRQNILHILEDPKLSTLLANNAKQRQLSHYDLSHNAKNWHAVYLNTLERSK